MEATIKHGIEVYKEETRYYTDPTTKRMYWGKWIYGKRRIDAVIGWTCVEGSV